MEDRILYWVLFGAYILTVVQGQGGNTFRNPILNYSSPDPFVLRHYGKYYMILSDSLTKMYILENDILTDWRTAKKELIYTAPNGMTNLFAPELHFLNGEMYIYFAMDDGKDENHRMYYLIADSPDNLLGGWSRETKIVVPEEDYFAIDGTVLTTTIGEQYFIWSGWRNATLADGEPYNANLYISRLVNSVTVSGLRVLLKEPVFTWEGTVVEAPEILKQPGSSKTFLTYSAASTWDDSYCLGLLSIEDGKNPLVVSNWVQESDMPAFWANLDGTVLGPGHASFTVSPDGKENWLVYHAMDESLNGENRTARTQMFQWGLDGRPLFPRPMGFDIDLVVPSGQTSDAGRNVYIFTTMAIALLMYLVIT